ncbi:MAG: hypothetical protein JO300_07090 [Silvibacterium sp.]|nr:hypothetical protein [Silvibacterium sp.]
MDMVFISAFSALAGSVVGGLTSGVTTWLGHRSQAKADQRMHNVTQREILYRDFVVAASEAFGDAISNSEPKLQQIVTLYGMISRMRIISGPDIVACAERTVELIIDTYFSPNRTLQEIHALMKSGETVDPLREFSEVARSELSAL